MVQNKSVFCLEAIICHKTYKFFFGRGSTPSHTHKLIQYGGAIPFPRGLRL